MPASDESPRNITALAAVGAGGRYSGGTVELGGVGVWSVALRYGAKGEVVDAAPARVEAS